MVTRGGLIPRVRQSIPVIIIILRDSIVIVIAVDAVSEAKSTTPVNAKAHRPLLSMQRFP